MKANPYFLLSIALVVVFLTAGIAGAETLVESPHPYANNYEKTWIVTQPGADQVRLHFTKLELGVDDQLQLLDEDNNVLKSYAPNYWSGVLLENDYWSEWYSVNTIKVKLITNNEGNYYGFRIDQVDVRTTEQPAGQDLYESWHNYANNYQSTWIVTQPGADQVRLHFTKLELGVDDQLQLLDEDNNVLKSYAPNYWSGVLLENDYWSEWYSVNTIKVKLITNNEGNYYGFRVDQVDPPITISLGIVSNLHNTTYNPNSITWAWTDPSSSDFDHVMIYLNGAFQGNVTKGAQVYSATGLSPSTAYTIGTRTVGTTGLVNSTWVNQTATTAPETPTPVPPDSISNLHNTTYNQNSVTWAWTDPSSSDFDHVMVYLNDVFEGNVTKGIQVYSVTGLSPSTAYTIGTITVGTSGLVNSTWVNQTATTAPEPPTPVPPDSISNLHNTTYNQDSITWTWTDPSSSDFDHVMVYLNDVFQGNVTKGTQVYSATSLSPSTAYTIGTKTVGTSGLVNSTWINQTTTTAPDSGPGILPPEAQFTSNTTSGPAPLTVQFNDSSNGTVTSYAWDFGDGASSTEKNPVHTYTSYGMYNVSLTVTNAVGEDTITKNDYIQVIPMVGGDKGYYLIHCNVEGAKVYFDDDYKGVITDGTLLVKIYLTATPYYRYSVSKVGYVTVNEALPSYPAKDETRDIFVTLVDVTDGSWTRPPYPEVTKIQPGYPDVNWTRPPYPEVTRMQPGYPDTNWTRPPYPEVTRIQPGYPDTNWTRPPYPEVTRIQPGYPDVNWTRPPYPDWLWSRLSIRNFLKEMFSFQ
ncbi:MAG: PKD domain-containing protein [Methanoregulaceae archaeon]|nr:PKD domain-containing protein [Methanoregulaceae archaeon]